MIPLNTNTSKVHTLFSAQTLNKCRFRLIAPSQVHPKMDVFMNQTSGRVIYRDSIRRRYYYCPLCPLEGEY